MQAILVVDDKASVRTLVRECLAKEGYRVAIARSIVEAHGGTIAVESELGRGTILTIELPVCNGRLQDWKIGQQTCSLAAKGGAR